MSCTNDRLRVDLYIDIQYIPTKPPMSSQKSISLGGFKVILSE